MSIKHHDHFARVLQAERDRTSLPIATHTMRIIARLRPNGAFVKHPSGEGLVVPFAIAEMVREDFGIGLADPNNLYLHGAMFEYMRHGKNTIVVGPTMQEALAETTLAGIPASELCAPYPAFFVAFPGNTTIATWTGNPGAAQYAAGHTMAENPTAMMEFGRPQPDEMPVMCFGAGWAPYTGAYVIWQGDDLHVQLVAAGGDPTAGKLNQTLGASRGHPIDDTASFVNTWFTLSLRAALEGSFEGTQPTSSSLGRMQANIEHMERSFPEPTQHESGRTVAEFLDESGTAVLRGGYPTGTDLESLINSTFENPGNDESLVQCADGAKLLGQREALTQGRAHTMRAMRIIINTVLYLNSASADVEQTQHLDPALGVRLDELTEQAEQATSGRARRKARREADRAYSRWLNSKTVVRVGPTIERRARAGGGGDGSRREHSRRGHWHRFHFGPMKDADGVKIPAERRPVRRLWVAPTWVTGSKSEVGSGRNYEFTDEAVRQLSE